MDFSTNRKLAVLVLIVSIIAFTFFGAARSIRAESKKVTELFYEGAKNEEGYTEKSIQHHLDNIIDSANGLLTVDGMFSRVLEEAENLKNARVQLMEAENLEDKYLAYIDTVKYAEDVYNILCGSFAASSSSSQKEMREMIDYYITQIRGADNAISKLSYNNAVSSYYRDISQFPASVFSDLFGIDGPEYFAVNTYLYEG